MSKKEWMKICNRCDFCPEHGSTIWCDFTDEAKKIGYKIGGNGEQGQIVGESRDGEKWWIRWSGRVAKYSYYKEFIKII